MVKLSFAVSLLAGSLGLASQARAQTANINGAWTDSIKNCDKLFEKKDVRYSIRKDSDSYGNALIIDGNRIIGKLASNCNVKERKQQGDTVYLVATCATTVAVERVSVKLKVVSADKFTLIFPSGWPSELGVEVPYERCSL